jgi:sulfate adenylyltransferase
MNSQSARETPLVPPYGGTLVNLELNSQEADELRDRANELPFVQLSERSLCDLELLATGAFSPLNRFMGQADYQNVLDEMRLASKHIFPIPITLPVNPSPHIREGNTIALRDSRNDVLAVMQIEEVYEWDFDDVTRKVFQTDDLRHPLLAEMHGWGKLHISGPLRVLRLPSHFDFADLRLSPTEVRARLGQLAGKNVVAFQTRNPLHRAHEELTKRAAADRDATLLLHPVAGLARPGDVDHYSRVRTYRVLTENYYDKDKALLTLLPLAMRFAGPREALWHALIRRNYGANLLIVGRDHASPGVDSNGKAFYPPYAAQELVSKFSEELGVGVVPFPELAYSPARDRYVEVAQVKSGERTLSISGTEMRRDYLEKGVQLPSWFSRPEVSKVLAETYRPRHLEGLCIWLTGLSCAGKSTIAEILITRLLEHGRRVTLLDGDVVRTNLSQGLGFSQKDRDTNIRRIGFVAAEIVHHGGVAVCAAVSPYRQTRNEVRNMVGADLFIEVFVDTPIDVCEQRDTKGMYAAARRGEIKNFTGIDDPYEPPQHPEITLDTISDPPETNARSIEDYLAARGFVKPAVGKGNI